MENTKRLKKKPKLKKTRRNKVAKDKLLQDGPGDVKEKPQVQEYRGDKGESDAKRGEETKAVDGYSR